MMLILQLKKLFCMTLRVGVIFPMCPIENSFYLFQAYDHSVSGYGHTSQSDISCSTELQSVYLDTACDCVGVSWQ